MKTKCPYCNYIATMHITLDKQKNPIEGDMSFCIDCGEISQYKNNELIKVDLESLNEPTKKQINNIRVAWLKTRAMQSVK